MAPNPYFPGLFQPGQIGNVKIKNRLVMAPMTTNAAGPSGEITQSVIDHYVECARGGVGLIILESVCVDWPVGKLVPAEITLHDDRFIGGHFALVEAVHANGAKIGAQINHAGRQSNLGNSQGMQLVSSSPVPTHFLFEAFFPTPRELTVEEIDQLMDKFASAAERAKAAGYDLVELHGAHGYLLTQFMSPFFNKRTDEFGGSLENRMRFPLGVIKRVREAVGKDYPLTMRISADEFVKGGITTEESPVIAKMLEEAGLAAIHVSSGIYETLELSNDSMPCKEGWKGYIAGAVTAAVKIPTIAVGGNKTPELCEQVIREGKAQFIAMGRQLFADPQWPNKAREGRVGEIRKCLSCNECLDLIFRCQTRCSINPALGREREFANPARAEVKKRVMIVGGGPAGMEAARIATLRGHDVTLYEKRSELGGQIKVAAAPPTKDKVLWFLDYLATQMKKLGVRVELGTEVTPELVERVKPDAVIIATGSDSIQPDLPGMEKNRVVTAWDVLSGEAEIKGKRVAVLGGWMVGCETADYLAARSNHVTVIARSAQPAPNMEVLNRIMLMRRLEEQKVEMLMEHDVVEVMEKGLLLVDKNSGEKKELPADYVVFARGAAPRKELLEALEGKVDELYSAGDCEKVGKFLDATYHAATAAMRI